MARKKSSSANDKIGKPEEAKIDSIADYEDTEKTDGEKENEREKKSSSANDKIGKPEEAKMDTIVDHRDTESTDGEKENEREKTPNFSSNEAIDGINISDSTIEIIGFVDSCERPKTVGTIKKYTIMKFVVNNGRGRRIQCVAWEDNVAKVSDLIAINKIVHLDRVSAKRLDPKFNMGNTPFELSIRQSTEIVDRGWYKAEECDSTEAKEVEWSDIADMEGQKITIKGWIKSTFELTRHKSGQATFGIGAVTDGKVKLEVRITTWSDMKKKIRKGEAVQLTGILKAEGLPYLQVADGSGIVTTSGSLMAPDAMINIVGIPQKKARVEQE